MEAIETALQQARADRRWHVRLRFELRWRVAALLERFQPERQWVDVDVDLSELSGPQQADLERFRLYCLASDVIDQVESRQ